MRRLALAAFLLVVCAAPARAGEISVSADRMEHQGEILTMKGNVTVRRDGARIGADTVYYDKETGQALAEGNVTYTDSFVSVTSSRAEISLEDETGTLYDSLVVEGAEGFRITSPEMRKTGRDRYHLTTARITTCDAPLPAWCFTGRDVDVVAGDRLSAWHATFRAWGLPVLYVPYVWVPIVTDRTSGFLVPEVGYDSDNGLRYRQNYFWVLAPNRDATLAVEALSDRGVGEGLEYRYVERSGRSGSLRAFHFRDGEADRDYFEGHLRHRERYAFVYLNHVNYREMYRELEVGDMDRSTRFMESRGEVHYPLADLGRAYLAARYFQDLSPDAVPETVPQALPEGGVFVAPRPLGPLTVSALAEATEFDRDSGLSGTRAQAAATAAHSVGRRVVLSQSLTARHTVYDLDDEAVADSSVRTEGQSYDYSASVSSILGRTYGEYRHTVEPQLVYQYVTLDGPAPAQVLDSFEYLSELSALSLVLTNRLAKASRNSMILSVTQAYDLRATGEEHPWDPLKIEAYIGYPFALSATLTVDTDLGRLATVSTSAALTLLRTALTLDHTYSLSTDINTLELHAGRTLTSRLSADLGLSYDEAEEEGIEELSVTLRYKRQCWGIELTYEERPDEFAVRAQVLLKGLGGYESTIYEARKDAETAL